MKKDKRNKRAKQKKKDAAIERADKSKQTQDGKEVYQNLTKRMGSKSNRFEIMKKYNEIVENVEYKNE